MSVIAVPFFIGAPIAGLATPPGEVLGTELSPGSPQQRMGVLYRELADRVADRVAERRVPLVYAGDCPAAIGVLAGLQRAGLDPALAWFDAHGDFHTWQTTRSGFLGGMPLAMIVGRGEQTIVAAAGLRPLAERRVALIGARDLDPGEDDVVAGSAMSLLRVDDVVDWTPPDGPLHVHVDLDVIDPAEMPAHRYPAPGGPSLAEVRSAIERLMATGRVAAVSFSTWDPGLPGADRAAEAARRLAEVVLEAAGEERP